VAAVPLAALDEVDVLQICGGRLDRIDQVPSIAEVAATVPAGSGFSRWPQEHVAHVFQA